MPLSRPIDVLKSRLYFPDKFLATGCLSKVGLGLPLAHVQDFRCRPPYSYSLSPLSNSLGAWVPGKSNCPHHSLTEKQGKNVVQDVEYVRFLKL